MSRNNHFFLEGTKLSFPIALGYIAVGCTYGISASQIGLSPFATLLMSVIVYAGSAQLVAVSLLAQNLPPLTIIITTFIINLRHLLMSIALSPFLKKWSKKILPYFFFQLTDETFSIHYLKFSQGKNTPYLAFLINNIAHISWISGTVLGIWLSNSIDNISKFGLDFALVGMFAVLLAWQIQSRLHLIVAIFSALLTLILNYNQINGFSIIIAPLIAATLGLYIQWKKKL